ncbi:Sucrase/ferredoxin-like-domain-containing protein [Pavlovales sp. CCMP2436]|nr:Sucrase/ferredoxin-like-domain-containing protein [Pavlovales sp. CCMP2436]
MRTALRNTLVLSSVLGAWCFRAHRHLTRRLRTGPSAIRCSDAVRAATDDADLGFARKEVGIEDLAGTCTPHDRHLFVLTEVSPSAWPPKWEESEGLPSALAKALKSRKGLPIKVKVTAATLAAGAGDAPGDVLMYPDGVRVRNVTPADAEALMDLVTSLPKGGLAADTPLLGAGGLALEPAQARAGGTPAAVFICAHTSRDKRCGLIGPALRDIFADELAVAGRQDVPVRMVSHVGGHVYAGNVIVYAQAQGHWYGYVDPGAAAELVREHIVGGTPLIRWKLWRGEVGLSEEEQKAKCEACDKRC